MRSLRNSEDSAKMAKIILPRLRAYIDRLSEFYYCSAINFAALKAAYFVIIFDVVQDLRFRLADMARFTNIAVYN